jgi:hydrogenase-4 component F
VGVLGEASDALNWTVLRAAAPRLDPALIKLAFVFILIGFGTKAGLAPMHTWLPDAHSQAPTPVSALLSSVLLNCAVYGILRYHMVASAVLGPDFSGTLLIGFGLLSVAVAVPFILVQRDLKRLLAYSSVEHMGIVVLAIGIGGPLGLFGGLLHLLNHALAKALLFFTAGTLSQRYGTLQLSRMRGAIQVAPLAGTLLLLGGFAIVGSPPFNIFLSEFSILSAGFTRRVEWVSLLFLACIALIFAGMLFHLGRIVWGAPPPEADGAAAPAPARPRRRPLELLLPLVLAVPIVGLGLYVPPPLTDVLQRVAALFQGAP